MSARIPELDDPAWLRERYETIGLSAIARELGCSVDTARRARRRHGIPGRPGRPAGIPDGPSTIAYRIAAAMAADDPVGPAALAERIRAIHRAQVAQDELALEQAVLSAASALALWLDRLQAHRRSLDA